MEKIKVLLKALSTLHDGIEYFAECKKAVDIMLNKHNERAFLSARDSIIQRFEYCTDLFWQAITAYLENEKIDIFRISERNIIRLAIASRLLSEDESDRFMKMIDARNKTSHIYHEIMAEEIAQQVPGFYELMEKIAERMQKRIDDY